MLFYILHFWFLGENLPTGRYGQSQIYVDEDHLLILGGCVGTNNVELTDVWLLEMQGPTWRNRFLMPRRDRCNYKNHSLSLVYSAKIAASAFLPKLLFTLTAMNSNSTIWKKFFNSIFPHYMAL